MIVPDDITIRVSVDQLKTEHIAIALIALGLTIAFSVMLGVLAAKQF